MSSLVVLKAGPKDGGFDADVRGGEKLVSLSQPAVEHSAWMHGSFLWCSMTGC